MTATPRPAALRFATRGSALALAQTRLAADALRAHAPDLVTEVVEVTTQGDVDRQTSLRVLVGQGVLVAAVREALLDGRADVAVHSLKDVPTAQAEGLVIPSMLERADPRDVFVGRDGARLADLPPGARVGTSASRRVAILRAIRPDLVPAEIRGTVDTCIARVRAGEYEGVILAAAGLARLGRLDEVTQVFEAEAFLPSPGQGVIALECRADDEATIALLRTVDDAPSHAAALAERGVLAALGTGCDLAVGAYARIDRDLLTVRGMLGGDREGTAPVFGDATSPTDEAEALGRGLGERLKAAYEERYGALQ
ncbi:MAG: hydroxymethylbilane synthase [Dehalococcoidia bacterium]|nr:hydroxymethylbilane synthase [Dehalococcoidia bacterium]